MPRVRRTWKVIHRRSDRDGNMLIVEEEPVYGNRKIYLHLTTEKGPRLLGEVDRQNQTLLVKRNRSKHLHHQMNAYGFNYALIHDAKMFNQVLVEEEFAGDKYRYLIPTSIIMEWSTVKNFKQDGFEIQYFLRFEYFNKFLTKKRFVQNKLLV
jgi:hypothetical protein